MRRITKLVALVLTLSFSFGAGVSGQDRKPIFKDEIELDNPLDCEASLTLGRYLEENNNNFAEKTTVRKLLDSLGFIHNNICGLPSTGIYRDRGNYSSAVPEAGSEGRGGPREKKRQVAAASNQAVELSETAAQSAPPEFETAVFKCVSDHQRCAEYFVEIGSSYDAGITCGFTYVVCVGRQLIPFTGK